MPSYMEFNENGLSEMEDFFNALQKPPVKLIARLERLLSTTFDATQGATHVITKSLKLSGKRSSDWDNVEWTGEITYGGESTGVNNPVEYAIYEMARGGSHDFLRPAYEAEPLFEAAIADYFPDEVDD